MAASRNRRGRRFGFSSRVKAAPQQPPHLCRLGFEPLEDRALLSVSLSLNGPQTIVPGATLNVSTDAANAQSEMSLVINLTNPLNVVGFSHRLENPITVEVYVSFDGGLNFSVSEIDTANDGLGAAGNRFDPALQFD